MSVHPSQWEIVLLVPLTAEVIIAFYFILEAFGTANLIPSAISVTASFVAAYLTARRSAYSALAYACNNAALIVLWLLATLEDMSYISMIICFVMFLVNDLYEVISWMWMDKKIF